MKTPYLIAAALMLPTILLSQNQGTVAEKILGSTTGVDVVSEDGSVLSKFNIFIRGYNGINSDSQPLLVVDGAYLAPNSDVDTPFWEQKGLVYTGRQNTLLGLDPSEIESIEVLSDLSATAIYGSKGANGVILIKTKRASEGRVTFDASAGANIQGADKTFIDRYSVSLDNTKNHNNLHFSGVYKKLAGVQESGRTGLFQLGFSSGGNGAVHFGFNSSTSLSNISQGNFRDVTNGDFEDDSRDVRSIGSLFLDIAVGKAFKLRADAGIDYHLKRRYLWFGPESQFGAMKNAAASLSEMEQFQYNLSVKGEFERYFSKHHVKAMLSADYVSLTPDYGVLCGYDFFMYTLKAKGINNAAGSSPNRSHNWNERNIGAVFTARYDWDGICGVNAAVRADFNPFFKEQITSVYPAADAFFDIAKLAFKGSKYVSKLSISAGYGKAGRESLIPYIFASDLSENIPEIDLDVQAFYNAAIRVRSEEFNAGVSTAVLR